MSILLLAKAVGMGPVMAMAGTAGGGKAAPRHTQPCQHSTDPHLRSEKKVGYTTRGATRTVTVGTPMSRRWRASPLMRAAMLGSRSIAMNTTGGMPAGQGGAGRGMGWGKEWTTCWEQSWPLRRRACSSPRPAGRRCCLLLRRYSMAGLLTVLGVHSGIPFRWLGTQHF